MARRSARAITPVVDVPELRQYLERNLLFARAMYANRPDPPLPPAPQAPEPSRKKYQLRRAFHAEAHAVVANYEAVLKDLDAGVVDVMRLVNLEGQFRIMAAGPWNVSAMRFREGRRPDDPTRVLVEEVSQNPTIKLPEVLARLRKRAAKDDPVIWAVGPDSQRPAVGLERLPANERALPPRAIVWQRQSDQKRFGLLYSQLARKLKAARQLARRRRA
jgi:hypothetical protein